MFFNQSWFNTDQIKWVMLFLFLTEGRGETPSADH